MPNRMLGTLKWTILIGIPMLLWNSISEGQDRERYQAGTNSVKAQAPATDRRQGSGRPYTVKDGIELSYFKNPSLSGDSETRPYPIRPAPIVSPDAKYFLLTTERGKLSDNTIEYKIWLFNRRDVVEYVSQQVSVRPEPRAIAAISAASNMPVVSGVRWLEDSKRVAFLGKSGTGYQQLFIADVTTGRVSAVTTANAFVSSYEIRGNTVAYATLTVDAAERGLKDPLVDVTGKTLESLLNTRSSRIEDLKWDDLYQHQSTLHIMRKQKETAIPGKQIKVFSPMWSLAPPLSLSPDGSSLITLARVSRIPPDWTSYAPGPIGFAPFKPKENISEDDEDVPSQFVLIDIRTGDVSPLVDAPEGGALGYLAPRQAFWSADGKHAILTNTFVPAGCESEDGERQKSPGIIYLDLSTHACQVITHLESSVLQGGQKHSYRLADISWNASKNEVALNYTGRNGGERVPAPDTYHLRGGKWIKGSESNGQPNGGSKSEVNLWTDETFARSPALFGRAGPDSAPVLVWDPNPQLATIDLGKVSVYEWKDKDGYSWSGLLALPPNYVPGREYPLVIQTHGYELTKYFADGMYTTGSGGRALTAKDIAVLQMDDPPVYTHTQKNGPFNLGGFEAAIKSLSAEGLVDSRRVGVVGFSFTCYHTLYAMTNHPDLFAAAAITDGNNVSYWQYIMNTTEAGGNTWQKLSEEINGGVPFGQTLLNWASRAPGFNLDKVRTPLLISALEQGQLLAQWEPYAGLRRLGKPVDMQWLRRGDALHVLVQPLHIYLSQQSAVDWFDFWLNGKERTEPTLEAGETKDSLAKQYERWRKLQRSNATPESAVGSGREGSNR